MSPSASTYSCVIIVVRTVVVALIFVRSGLVILRCEHDLCLVAMAVSSAAATSGSCSAVVASAAYCWAAVAYQRSLQALLQHDLCWSAYEQQHEQQTTQQHHPLAHTKHVTIYHSVGLLKNHCTKYNLIPTVD